ncbi:hypothetical protein BC943DRAFT_359463 [Umbelopsis sp. AD052]|nr:hypothetical protein BC943DRAFT_359463 [Umbelopsis sp. AD052]
MNVVAPAGAESRNNSQVQRSFRKWWKKVTNKNQPAPYPGHMAPRNQKHGVFGVALPQSIRYARANISYIDDESGERLTGYIPIIIAKCGSHLKEEGLQVEGIFRLSGSAKRVKELEQIFDSPEQQWGATLSWDGYTVHDSANILRRFLNFLPNPVITHQLYQPFRDVMSDKSKKSTQERISAFQTLIERLPLPHQFLLLYLLDMLSIFASNDEVNRMNASNLAAVFTPGMLSHPSHDLHPVQYKISQRVVEFLIEFHMCFHMPHATALHKDPVMHPTAAHMILPPQPNTPQEVVLNEPDKLKKKTSSGTLGSQRSAKTITQQNHMPPVSPSNSFVTADQLSLSIAPSFISTADEPATPRSEVAGQIGSFASSPKPTSPPGSVKTITPKASPISLSTSRNGEREMASVPEHQEGIDKTVAHNRGRDFTVSFMGVPTSYYAMFTAIGPIFIYEMYGFFNGGAIESIVFFSALSSFFALLVFGMEHEREIDEKQSVTPATTPDIEEKTLVEDHGHTSLLRTSMSSLSSSVMYDSPKTQDGFHEWDSLNRRSTGADSGYVTLAGSRELHSEYGNTQVIEPTSIKSVFRDSEGRYLSSNPPYPVAAGDFSKPDEIDLTSGEEEGSDEADESEDECESIWLFDNASIAEDQAAEQAMLQNKEIMAEWKDLLTRSWKTDIGTSQKKVAFVPSSENSLIEDTEAASILTVSSRFNEEIQDDIATPNSDDEDEVIADDIDPDQLYRMWDRIQQQITEDEKLALKLQLEEEAAEAKRQYELNTLNPFLNDDKSATSSNQTTPRPPPAQQKN